MKCVKLGKVDLNFGMSPYIWAFPLALWVDPKHLIQVGFLLFAITVEWD